MKLNLKETLLLKQAHRARTDLINPVCMLLLSITGIFFIYSAQSYGPTSHWKAQIFWVGLGGALYTLISMINYKVFLKNAHFIYGISILLLLLLWTPMGQERFGALRWLNFGVLSVQPSEIAKIGTLIMTAGLLTRSEIGTFRESLFVLTKVGLIFLLPILLIFLQPDLGSALVFPPMVFSLLYVSKLSARFFLTAFGLFLLGMTIVGIDIYRYHIYLKENQITPTENRGGYEGTSYLPLKDYQRNRIIAFIAPEVVDPRGIGVSWNLRQSLIAVGSGGPFGKGHTHGTQAKLGYLPQSVATNDFIFSVLAEELGFTGGIFVIGLYILLLGNGLRIAHLARDRFGMLLCVGASIILMVHIFINIGMTIGLMPITGLPLPFLSYGGSFILSCCILQGLIQSVYRFRKDFS